MSCSGANTEPITAQTPGIWNHYFVYPLSQLIIFIAKLLNENYGLAIIVVTIIVRLLLFPLIIKQLKTSQVMQKVQLELNELKERKDLQEDQQKYMQEMMTVFQKYKVNPFSGCLPLFIQMPILIAFYYAIMRTQEIALHSFLWFSLGSADPYFILPVVATVTTYLSLKTATSGYPNQPQMNIMLYVMPAMIFAAAVVMPSALVLYWIVGNLFSIGQSYILNVQKRKWQTESE